MSISTLELLPNLALACLPPELKPAGEVWIADLRKLVLDPISDPAAMSALVARLPALLQHLSKPFLAFAASVIVSDLRQYLPVPPSAAAGAASGSSAPQPEPAPVAAGVKLEAGAEGSSATGEGAAAGSAAASKKDEEERNRKALEKLVAGVFDMMLAHQQLLARPPPPSPAPAPPSSSSTPAKRPLANGAPSGSAGKRARPERVKGIQEMTEEEVDQLARVPEPERYKTWLSSAFVANPSAQVSQAAFWTSYTSTFRPALERLGSTMPPLLSPGEAIKNVGICYEAAAPKMAGEGENKVFIISGIEPRPFPPRAPTPDADLPAGVAAGPTNAQVMQRLDGVEGKLDKVLAALAQGGR